MGRHRSDPLGIARLALVGLAVVLLLAVIVIGGRALFSTFGSGQSGDPAAVASSSPAARPSAAASPPSVPTVRVVCQADRCPVFVRVPGGDVLVDRDLARGEQASYFDPELDVVLDDASTVEVFTNGAARSPGPPGERQAFSVRRSPGP